MVEPLLPVFIRFNGCIHPLISLCISNGNSSTTDGSISSMLKPQLLFGFRFGFGIELSSLAMAVLSCSSRSILFALLWFEEEQLEPEKYLKMVPWSINTSVECYYIIHIQKKHEYHVRLYKVSIKDLNFLLLAYYFPIDTKLTFFSVTDLLVPVLC